jgi:tRNA (guanine-N7-)-methyltransferase
MTDAGSVTGARAGEQLAAVLQPPPAVPPGPGRALIAWRRAPFPIDWERAFGRAAQLHVEVGFGDGRFTVRRALAEPDANHVGLEVSSASVQRALAQIRREHVGNVRVAKVGAALGLRLLFAPRELASITVNFPDPWPKQRHERHRLLRRPFFELAASRLRPAGEIRLATDHVDYLAFARSEAHATGRYGLPRHEPPAAVRETKYALKWRGEGRPLHYQVFRLERPTDSHPPHLERPEHMPHAFLTGSSSAPADLPAEAKRIIAYGDAHVIVHEGWEALGGRERWLFRVTVDEPELTQQVLVVASRRPDGEVIVRLERFGDPLITAAVRGAVHGVVEWLVEHAGLVVRERNY